MILGTTAYQVLHQQLSLTVVLQLFIALVVPLLLFLLQHAIIVVHWKLMLFIDILSMYVLKDTTVKTVLCCYALMVSFVHKVVANQYLLR